MTQQEERTLQYLRMGQRRSSSGHEVDLSILGSGQSDVEADFGKVDFLSLLKILLWEVTGRLLYQFLVNQQLQDFSQRQSIVLQKPKALRLFS